MSNFYDWWSDYYDEHFAGKWVAHETKKAAQAAWQAAQPRWRPIETAPDRQEIMIYMEEQELVCTATRDGNNWWFTVGNGDIYEIDYPIYITHWMPIPQPPED